MRITISGSVFLNRRRGHARRFVVLSWRQAVWEEFDGVTNEYLALISGLCDTASKVSNRK